MSVIAFGRERPRTQEVHADGKLIGRAVFHGAMECWFFEPVPDTAVWAKPLANHRWYSRAELGSDVGAAWRKAR